MTIRNRIADWYGASANISSYSDVLTRFTYANTASKTSLISKKKSRITADNIVAGKISAKFIDIGSDSSIPIHIGSYASAPTSPINNGNLVDYTIKVGDSYYNTTNNTMYFYSSSGWTSTSGLDGTDGTDGARGSVSVFSSFSSTPTDAQLNAVIYSVTGGSLPKNGDNITYTIATSGTKQAYYMNGWIKDVMLYVHGDAIIAGTLSASAIQAGGTISANGGTILTLNSTTDAESIRLKGLLGDYQELNWMHGSSTTFGLSCNGYEVIGNTFVGSQKNAIYIDTSTAKVSFANDVDISGSIFRAVGAYNSTTASASNVYVASDGRFQRSTSSLKYKTNIEDVEDKYAYNFLNNARPIYYKSLSENDNAQWGWWGFIAEELSEVDKRLVSWQYETKEVPKEIILDDGTVITSSITEIVKDTSKPMQPEGVYYDRITVLLTKIVQDQQKTIKELTDRIENLESKIVDNLQ